VTSPGPAPVVVIGGGIAGIAAARELVDQGVAVRVLDRGRRLGGRIGARAVAGRAVDVGASYFTVPDPDGPFAAVVRDWQQRGLAREWTDTFAVAEGGRLTGAKSGPMRWGAADGLRSLVADLASGLSVTFPIEVAAVRRDGASLSVDGEPAAAVVLAMPDAQARRLLQMGGGLGDESGEPAPGLGSVAGALTRQSDPQIAVAAGWKRRWWPEFAAAFVNDSEAVSFLADDGSRHGDGAAVLVAHVTPSLSARHLDDPDAVIAPVLDEVRGLLGGDGGGELSGSPDWAPGWSLAKRWALAKPTGRREQPYLLTEPADGPPVAVCGDGWGGPSRVAQAFASGHATGRAIAARLLAA